MKRKPEDDLYKRRLLFGIIGSLLLVYLGWYLFYSAEKQQLISADVMEVIGIIAMIFFGCAALIGLKKYFSDNG